MLDLLMSVVFWAFIYYVVVRCFVKLSAGRCESSVCLSGKTAIVTGGNSGLGYQMALDFASRNCRVIIADIANSEKTVQKLKEKTHNPNILYKHVDLTNFDSVRAFAKDINATEERVDILMNNAGSWGFGEDVTKEGVPLTMQLNHFGPFLLTHLLVDKLKQSAPSRVVFTSSFLSYTNKLQVGGLTSIPKYKEVIMTEMFLYGNSKLCNMMSADGFAKRLEGTGVTVNSFHPGWCATRIWERTPKEKYFLRVFNWVTEKLYMKSSKEGAQTAIHLAVSDEVKDTTGQYFLDCRAFPKPGKAHDAELCRYVWEESEKIVNLKPEEKLMISKDK